MSYTSRYYDNRGYNKPNRGRRFRGRRGRGRGHGYRRGGRNYRNRQEQGHGYQYSYSPQRDQHFGSSRRGGQGYNFRDGTRGNTTPQFGQTKIKKKSKEEKNEEVEDDYDDYSMDSPSYSEESDDDKDEAEEGEDGDKFFAQVDEKSSFTTEKQKSEKKRITQRKRKRRRNDVDEEMTMTNLFLENILKKSGAITESETDEEDDDDSDEEEEEGEEDEEDEENEDEEEGEEGTTEDEDEEERIKSTSRKPKTDDEEEEDETDDDENEDEEENEFIQSNFIKVDFSNNLEYYVYPIFFPPNGRTLIRRIWIYKELKNLFSPMKKFGCIVTPVMVICRSRSSIFRKNFVLSSRSTKLSSSSATTSGSTLFSSPSTDVTRRESEEIFNISFRVEKIVRITSAGFFFDKGISPLTDESEDEEVGDESISKFSMKKSKKKKKKRKKKKYKRFVSTRKSTIEESELVLNLIFHELLFDDEDLRKVFQIDMDQNGFRTYSSLKPSKSSNNEKFKSIKDYLIIQKIYESFVPRIVFRSGGWFLRITPDFKVENSRPTAYQFLESCKKMGIREVQELERRFRKLVLTHTLYNENEINARESRKEESSSRKRGSSSNASFSPIDFRNELLRDIPAGLPAPSLLPHPFTGGPRSVFRLRYDLNPLSASMCDCGHKTIREHVFKKHFSSIRRICPWIRTVSDIREHQPLIEVRREGGIDDNLSTTSSSSSKHHHRRGRRMSSSSTTSTSSSGSSSSFFVIPQLVLVESSVPSNCPGPLLSIWTESQTRETPSQQRIRALKFLKKLTCDFFELGLRMKSFGILIDPNRSFLRCKISRKVENTDELSSSSLPHFSEPGDILFSPHNIPTKTTVVDDSNSSWKDAEVIQINSDDESDGEDEEDEDDESGKKKKKKKKKKQKVKQIRVRPLNSVINNDRLLGIHRSKFHHHHRHHHQEHRELTFFGLVLIYARSLEKESHSILTEILAECRRRRIRCPAVGQVNTFFVRPNDPCSKVLLVLKKVPRMVLCVTTTSRSEEMSREMQVYSHKNGIVTQTVCGEWWNQVGPKQRQSMSIQIVHRMYLKLGGWIFPCKEPYILPVDRKFNHSHYYQHQMNLFRKSVQQQQQHHHHYHHRYHNQVVVNNSSFKQTKYYKNVLVNEREKFVTYTMNRNVLYVGISVGRKSDNISQKVYKMPSEKAVHHVKQQMKSTEDKEEEQPEKSSSRKGKKSKSSKKVQHSPPPPQQRQKYFRRGEIEVNENNEDNYYFPLLNSFVAICPNRDWVRSSSYIIKKKKVFLSPRDGKGSIMSEIESEEEEEESGEEDDGGGKENNNKSSSNNPLNLVQYLWNLNDQLYFEEMQPYADQKFHHRNRFYFPSTFDSSSSDYLEEDEIEEIVSKKSKKKGKKGKKNKKHEQMLLQQEQSLKQEQEQKRDHFFEEGFYHKRRNNFFSCSLEEQMKMYDPQVGNNGYMCSPKALEHAIIHFLREFRKSFRNEKVSQIIFFQSLEGNTQACPNHLMKTRVSSLSSLLEHHDGGSANSSANSTPTGGKNDEHHFDFENLNFTPGCPNVSQKMNKGEKFCRTASESIFFKSSSSRSESCWNAQKSSSVTTSNPINNWSTKSRGRSSATSKSSTSSSSASSSTTYCGDLPMKIPMSYFFPSYRSTMYNNLLRKRKDVSFMMMKKKPPTPLPSSSSVVVVEEVEEQPVGNSKRGRSSSVVSTSSTTSSTSTTSSVSTSSQKSKKNKSSKSSRKKSKRRASSKSSPSKQQQKQSSSTTSSSSSSGLPSSTSSSNRLFTKQQIFEEQELLTQHLVQNVNLVSSIHVHNGSSNTVLNNNGYHTRNNFKGGGFEVPCNRYIFSQIMKHNIQNVLSKVLTLGITRSGKKANLGYYHHHHHHHHPIPFSFLVIDNCSQNDIFWKVKVMKNDDDDDDIEKTERDQPPQKNKSNNNNKNKKVKKKSGGVKYFVEGVEDGSIFRNELGFKKKHLLSDGMNIYDDEDEDIRKHEDDETSTSAILKQKRKQQKDILENIGDLQNFLQEEIYPELNQHSEEKEEEEDEGEEDEGEEEEEDEEMNVSEKKNFLSTREYFLEKQKLEELRKEEMYSFFLVSKFRKYFGNSSSQVNALKKEKLQLLEQQKKKKKSSLSLSKSISTATMLPSSLVSQTQHVCVLYSDLLDVMEERSDQEILRKIRREQNDDLKVLIRKYQKFKELKKKMMEAYRQLEKEEEEEEKEQQKEEKETKTKKDDDDDDSEKDKKKASSNVYAIEEEYNKNLTQIQHYHRKIHFTLHKILKKYTLDHSLRRSENWKSLEENIYRTSQPFFYTPSSSDGYCSHNNLILNSSKLPYVLHLANLVSERLSSFLFFENSMSAPTTSGSDHPSGHHHHHHQQQQQQQHQQENSSSSSGSSENNNNKMDTFFRMLNGTDASDNAVGQSCGCGFCVGLEKRLELKMNFINIEEQDQQQDGGSSTSQSSSDETDQSSSTDGKLPSHEYDGREFEIVGNRENDEQPLQIVLHKNLANQLWCL